MTDQDQVTCFFLTLWLNTIRDVINNGFSISYQTFVNYVRWSPYPLIQLPRWNHARVTIILLRSVVASCTVGASMGYLESASALPFFLPGLYLISKSMFCYEQYLVYQKGLAYLGCSLSVKTTHLYLYKLCLKCLSAQTI